MQEIEDGRFRIAQLARVSLLHDYSIWGRTEEVNVNSTRTFYPSLT